MTEVRVSAAIVVDRSGRALVVRKHGTVVFQQPGGKPDPGESALDAVVREVAELRWIVQGDVAATPLAPPQPQPPHPLRLALIRGRAPRR